MQTIINPNTTYKPILYGGMETVNVVNNTAINKLNKIPVLANRAIVKIDPKSTVLTNTKKAINYSMMGESFKDVYYSFSGEYDVIELKSRAEIEGFRFFGAQATINLDVIVQYYTNVSSYVNTEAQPLLSDSFSGSDGAYLTSRSPEIGGYQLLSGSESNLQILSNELKFMALGSTADKKMYVDFLDCFLRDVSLEFTISNSATGSFMSFHLRKASDNPDTFSDCVSLAILVPDLIVVRSSSTNLYSYASSMLGVKFKLELIGTSVKFYVGGVEVYSGINSLIPNAGKTRGFLAQSASPAAPILDSLVVRPL